MINQKVKFGNNAILELKGLLLLFNPKKILLVVGKSSFSKSGAKKILEPILQKNNYDKFYNQSEFDEIQNIIDGVKLIKANNYDLMVAIGGGGVIDKGKIINILSTTLNDNLEESITQSEYGSSKIPIIAIPTTAGTGSESTKFATLYINKIKYSIEDESIIPKAIIIDPVLIKTNSTYTMLSAGLDALSQSIESYWSVNSNKESKKYALDAMKMIWNILPKIISKKISSIEMKNLSWAAHLSGKAINISKTTASHAISYYLTSNYGIAHGHAVAITLGYVFKLNLEVSVENLNEKRGFEYSINNLHEICKVLKIEMKNVNESFESYLKKLKLKTRLREFGIDKKDLEIIANNINTARIKNNPRKLSNNDILHILEEIY